MSQTKDLAGSLLSEIEPIQADLIGTFESYDAEAGEGGGSSSSSDSDSDAEGEGQGFPAAGQAMHSEYKSAFQFLSSAVRKSKAAMKYMKASKRAQLQAREVALTEAIEERDASRRERKALEERLETLEEDLEEAEDHAENLEMTLAASASAKDSSLAGVQRELEAAQGR